jgi:hypothetical protein
MASLSVLICVFVLIFVTIIIFISKNSFTINSKSYLFDQHLWFVVAKEVGTKDHFCNLVLVFNGPLFYSFYNKGRNNIAD